MKIILSKGFKKAKKKKEWDPNPWAVCHTTVDKDKDPEKYERCVQDVKSKQSSNNFKKEAKNKRQDSIMKRRVELVETLRKLSDK